MSTKERPIIFSGPMVKAILDGRKTQTRRIIKQQPERGVHECPYVPSGYSHGSMSLEDACGCVEIRSPYGKPGDRLWVRETWSIEALGAVDYEITYRADGATRDFTHNGRGEDPYVRYYDTQRGDWHSPIHMPRWASRILLEVVSVRVERLQEISEDDALGEGVEPPEEFDFFDPRENNRTWYARLWESIHGKGSWSANPWVWVVEFKRVEGGAA